MAANSQGKDQPLQQTGGLWDGEQYWPDNQQGLEDSQATIPGDIPSQRHVEPPVSSPTPKPGSKKPTAAKSKPAKPVATPQQKQVEAPSGSSSAAPDNHADKSKTPKAHQNKSKLKTPKAKAKSKVWKRKQPKGAKGSKKIPVKKPATDTSKDKPDKSHVTDKGKTTNKNEPDKSPATIATDKGKKRQAQDPPVHKNPGGRSSGSGIKKSTAGSPSASEPAAAEPPKRKRTKQPDQQGQGKANHGAAAATATPGEVVAALQRADTLEQEEKDAKRKAYKARKQRFYNSLVSGDLKDFKKNKNRNISCTAPTYIYNFSILAFFKLRFKDSIRFEGKGCRVQGKYLGPNTTYYLSFFRHTLDTFGQTG